MPTAMPTTLKMAKTLWGVDEAADTGKWDALFARIKADGFDGVEAIAPTWRSDPALLTSLLEKHGLALICQIHTTGGDIVDGEYVYCSSSKLDDHTASFEALATEAAALEPALINSHSGHDSWGSGERAVAFFRHALQVEARLGVPIVHETHRQRLLYSPYPTAELLSLPELAALKINADLSHWCCEIFGYLDSTHRGVKHTGANSQHTATTATAAMAGSGQQVAGCRLQTADT